MSSDVRMDNVNYARLYNSNPEGMANPVEELKSPVEGRAYRFYH